ncbi:hypothetical protein [Rhodococcus sp. H29-C3]|uniref:hypothetical protein n=1 Tax=Rhodococcus sp. H29-C3 TaxID=3046307 RepID=UPI0024B9B825|nr:hypothetical protein [Rhodococcus sp. H29-C3]MDJ0362575.1 hypothetical protein [Rhodococcus sp. H29-C3]
MTDRDGRVPLRYAAKDNACRKDDAGLAAGADANAADNPGFTPLHFAPSRAQWRQLAHGARVDTEYAYGNSPLRVTLLNPSGPPEILELLLAHGSDVHQKNTSG